MATYTTIQELARRAQVSTSTIDRILSGRGQVKPATIEHVLAVAEQANFYATETIRKRLTAHTKERRLGFLLNDLHREFYRELAAELSLATTKAVSIQGKPVVVHLSDMDPLKTAEALIELGKTCDAVASVCIDHPAINAAISDLRAKHVPVVSMISDVSSPDRAAFVGSNDWQLGRTAGWFAGLFRKTGTAGVLMGSERYISQQSAEAGFRNYLRSEVANLKLAETRITLESDEVACEVAGRLIDECPDLSVLFVAGGGIDGVLRAIASRQQHTGIAVIAGEMTVSTRSQLAGGGIDIILVHPIKEIARQAVNCLIKLTTGTAPNSYFQQIVPFTIVGKENV